MAEIKLWPSTKCLPEQASSKEYENEAELHRIIERNPQFLPMSGRQFERLISWAEEMAKSKKINLTSYAGASPTLILYVDQSDLVMAAIRNVRQEPRIAVYRTAFDHHAPCSIEKVEEAIAPRTIGHGNYIGDISDRVLIALTEAFEEAGSC